MPKLLSVLVLGALLATAAGKGCPQIQDVVKPPAATGNLLANAGFEERAGGLPSAWQTEARAADKGRVEVVTGVGRSGSAALRLSPNANNRDADLANHPLQLGQAVAAGPYRGKSMHFSAWMKADGGCTAVVELVAWRRSGALTRARLQFAGPELTLRDDVLAVPNDPSVEYLIVICLAEGTAGAATFDDLTLSAGVPAGWGRPEARDEGPPLEASVVVEAGRTVRRLPETLFGTNIEWGWDGNGLWDARLGQLDPTLVRLTREAKMSLLRFPGGFFADFYHWKDGTGPQSARPESHHFPEGPTSRHNFGTDEALSFARATGGSLMINVNIVTGTPEEAAEWVRYVNRPGRGTPRVTYWEIGNEHYVREDSPWSRPATMPPDKYARRFLEFARAMRAADPTIRLGAISDINYGHIAPRAYPNWTETVLRIAGQEIDFLDVHCGYAPGLWNDKGWSVRTVYAAMLAAPRQMRSALDEVTALVDRVVPERSDKIELCVAEWGPYFQIDPAGRFVHHVKTLGSALLAADIFKVFAESPRVGIAEFMKLNDLLYMGWIGKRRGEWVPTASYYAFQLYRQHFGRVVVPSSVVCPGYDSQGLGTVDPSTNTPYLSVVASRSDDRGRLWVMAINKHFDRAIRAKITLRGFTPAAAGTAWVLHGTGIDANTGTELHQAAKWGRQAVDELNPRFDHGGPDEVRLTSRSFQGAAATFEYELPPHSVTALELQAR